MASKAVRGEAVTGLHVLANRRNGKQKEPENTQI